MTAATLLLWSFPDTDSVRDNNPEVAQPKLPLGGRAQLFVRKGVYKLFLKNKNTNIIRHFVIKKKSNVTYILMINNLEHLQCAYGKRSETI